MKLKLGFLFDFKGSENKSNLGGEKKVKIAEWGENLIKNSRSGKFQSSERGDVGSPETF